MLCLFTAGCRRPHGPTGATRALVVICCPPAPAVRPHGRTLLVSLMPCLACQCTRRANGPETTAENEAVQEEWASAVRSETSSGTLRPRLPSGIPRGMAPATTRCSGAYREGMRATGMRSQAASRSSETRRAAGHPGLRSQSCRLSSTPARFGPPMLNSMLKSWRAMLTMLTLHGVGAAPRLRRFERGSTRASGGKNHAIHKVLAARVKQAVALRPDLITMTAIHATAPWRRAGRRRNSIPKRSKQLQRRCSGA